MTDDLLRSGLSRRRLIQFGLAGGAALWAGSSVLSAGAGSRRRLVVMMLQGGVDGLSLAPPLRDADYHRLRGPLAIASPLRFTADFGLHPAMPSLARMAAAGEVRLIPAAGSPTRTRSHFTEWDVLSTGRAGETGLSTGWLNRAVAALAPSGKVAAVSLDAVATAAVAGAAPFAAWSPGLPPIGAGLSDALADLYRGDARLKGMLASNLALQRQVEEVDGGPTLPPLAARARGLGRLLARGDGPVAGFLSTGGFDTHQDQGGEHGALADRLREVDQALAALRDASAEAWAHTVVLVFTEFGRTAAVNGASGTDHGVGSAALLVGGALKRGGIVGDWPTLAPGALHEGRDLAPTLDLRAVFRGVLAEHLGLSRAVLDAQVFPGSSSLPDVRGLIA